MDDYNYECNKGGIKLYIAFSVLESINILDLVDVCLFSWWIYSVSTCHLNEPVRRGTVYLCFWSVFFVRPMRANICLNLLGKNVSTISGHSGPGHLLRSSACISFNYKQAICLCFFMLFCTLLTCKVQVFSDTL